MFAEVGDYELVSLPLLAFERGCAAYLSHRTGRTQSEHLSELWVACRSRWCCSQDIGSASLVWRGKLIINASSPAK